MNAHIIEIIIQMATALSCNQMAAEENHLLNVLQCNLCTLINEEQKKKSEEGILRPLLRMKPIRLGRGQGNNCNRQLLVGLLKL